MRFWLLCLALIFVGCTPTDTAAPPTLRGAVVPTRVIPTATDTLTATTTPTEIPPSFTPTATETPAATLTPTAQPSETPSPTAVDTETPLPSPTVTNTIETPSPTVTNTVETPSPTVTDTVETPTPTVTDTPETLVPQPTDMPEFVPFVYRNATSLEPVEIRGEIALESAAYGTIDDQHPVALYNFTGTAGMTIDVLMRQQSGDLDPYLLVLDPKGREIARNDDLDEDSGDSAVHSVVLPEGGAYVIVASRYMQRFGITSGDFELLVSAEPLERVGTFSRPIGYESSVNGALEDGVFEEVYTFRATAGDIVSVQMTMTSGNLDPNITLTDNLGTTLVRNDDNLLLGTLDAAIQGYIIPRSGYYSLIARTFDPGSESGTYRLKLSLDGQNANSLFAVLNPANSASMSEEGTLFTNFSIGDEIDNEDSREHVYQVLLTFELPPASDRSIESARFAIAPCYERGGGFAALGTLTIYADNYGGITETRNISRPLPGARVLSTQSSCDPLDLTEIVSSAYATGNEDVQLRLIFRQHENNGTTDSVLITPSLLVTFGS